MERLFLRIGMAAAVLVGAVSSSVECGGEDDGSCHVPVKANGKAFIQLGSEPRARAADSLESSLKEQSPIIEDYVEKELLPEAQQTLKALQDEVNRLEGDVDKCSSIMLNHTQDTGVEESELKLAEHNFITCDDALQEITKGKAESCALWKLLLSQVKWPEGLNMSAATSTADRARILYEQWKFVTENAPKVQEASIECHTHTKALEKHKGDCDEEQAALSKAFCTLKRSLSGECGEYEKCYAAKLEIAKSGIKKVMKLEEHNKNSYKYRYCFNKDKCDPATVDIATLNVNYGSMPDKATCIQGIHTERAYPSIQCDASTANDTASSSAATVDNETSTSATEEEESKPSNETSEAAGQNSSEGNSLLSKLMR